MYKEYTSFNYDKECSEEGIRPHRNTKLIACLGVDVLHCEYCDEDYYPLKELYNMEFDKAFTNIIH